MVPDDGNFKKIEWPLSPCQNAPPQEGSETSTEAAAQATLPPDEHKAVRWEGGDRRNTTRKEREKRDDELANFDPSWR